MERAQSRGARMTIRAAIDIEKILAECEERRIKRVSLMPDEESAVKAMFEAWYRLKELGWKEADYAKPDGKLMRIIEAGSSGIHEGYCEPTESPRGKWWWCPQVGDLWPSQPLLFKERA